MIDNETLNQKIAETFLAYSNPSYNGTRSSKKLYPFHSYIANSINEITENKFHIHSLGFEDSKEKAVKGMYYKKNVDIAISNDKKDLMACEIKVITASYGKNGKNYFENMLGANANLRRAGLPVAQIVIIPSYVPCYNSKGELSRIEYLTSTRLDPYVNLDDDILSNLFHKADLTFIYIIDTNNIEYLQNNIGKKLDKTELSASYNITSADISNLSVNERIKEFLTKQQDYTRFIKAINNLLELQEYRS